MSFDPTRLNQTGLQFSYLSNNNTAFDKPIKGNEKILELLFGKTLNEKEIPIKDNEKILGLFSEKIFKELFIKSNEKILDLPFGNKKEILSIFEKLIPNNSNQPAQQLSSAVKQESSAVANKQNVHVEPLKSSDSNASNTSSIQKKEESLLRAKISMEAKMIHNNLKSYQENLDLLRECVTELIGKVKRVKILKKKINSTECKQLRRQSSQRIKELEQQIKTIMALFSNSEGSSIKQAFKEQACKLLLAIPRKKK